MPAVERPCKFDTSICMSLTTVGDSNTTALPRHSSFFKGRPLEKCVPYTLDLSVWEKEVHVCGGKVQAQLDCYLDGQG